MPIKQITFLLLKQVVFMDPHIQREASTALLSVVPPLSKVSYFQLQVLDFMLASHTPRKEDLIYYKDNNISDPPFWGRITIR